MKYSYLINPTELDLQGKTAFFWAATAALTTVWAYFRLPEVKVRIFLHSRFSKSTCSDHISRTVHTRSWMSSSRRSSRPGNSSPRRCMSTKIQNIRYSLTKAKDRSHIHVPMLTANLLGEGFLTKAWCFELNVSR